MQSNMIKAILTLIILSSIFVSCNKETNNDADSLTETKPVAPRIYEDIEVVGDNKSSYYLDDKIVTPAKTEGHYKEKNNIYQYTVMSYSGTEGYFFELNLSKGESIVGEHDISKNGNRLILNHKKDGMLTVYGSAFCKDAPGFITIEEHDTEANTITGNFTIKVCNDGMIGELGEKTLHKCKFNKVSLVGIYN